MSPLQKKVRYEEVWADPVESVWIGSDPEAHQGSVCLWLDAVEQTGLKRSSSSEVRPV